MEKLIIIGKSDAVITMITDNLESNNLYPQIEIINNLKLPIEYDFKNPKFSISIKEHLEIIDNCFLGVNKSLNKRMILKLFEIDVKKFINITHKSSCISSTTKIGNGCLINSLVSIASHTTIGNFVSINRNSSIGHHTILNDFVTVHPGSNIAGHVEIGKNTLIGMGTNIIDGIKIGKNSIIGAGSLVVKNVPDNVVAYGNPCKIIRNNETQSI